MSSHDCQWWYAKKKTCTHHSNLTQVVVTKTQYYKIISQPMEYIHDRKDGPFESGYRKDLVSTIAYTDKTKSRLAPSSVEARCTISNVRDNKAQSQPITRLP